MGNCFKGSKKTNVQTNKKRQELKDKFPVQKSVSDRQVVRSFGSSRQLKPSPHSNTLGGGSTQPKKIHFEQLEIKSTANSKIMQEQQIETIFNQDPALKKVFEKVTNNFRE